ncbi:MAG: hypothetical protein ACYDEP_04140 [Acidimicrobiales bacterium]
MSTLWTPSGEYPVTDSTQRAKATQPTSDHPGPQREPQSANSQAPSREFSDSSTEDPSVAAEELRRQLADAPAEVVIANHCYGLFELAAVYLSQQPPLLPQAQLAIDALAGLVGTLGDRLGEAAPSLQQALSQIQVAFVEISQAQSQSQSQ